MSFVLLFRFLYLYMLVTYRISHVPLTPSLLCQQQFIFLLLTLILFMCISFIIICPLLLSIFWFTLSQLILSYYIQSYVIFFHLTLCNLISSYFTSLYLVASSYLLPCYLFSSHPDILSGLVARYYAVEDVVAPEWPPASTVYVAEKK